MELNAEKRQEFGKDTKKLRRERKVPGVIFGKGMESMPITVDVHAFTKIFQIAGETNLVDIKLPDGTEKVLIKEVQVHPVSSSIIHVNFHKVNLKEKVTADIPFEILGEEENELIKNGEAIALTLLNEITIEALPTDLPDRFEINVAELKEIGDSFSIADLSYDRDKVEIVGNEETDLIVKLDYAVSEEEEETELSEEELLERIEVTGESEDEESEDGDQEDSE